MKNFQYDMFKEYEDDNPSLPDNRPFGADFCYDKQTFVPGGTNQLAFSFLGLDKNDVVSLNLEIESGVSVSFSKSLSDVELVEADPYLYVLYSMPADESALCLPERDLRAQCKLALPDGSVICSALVRYKVLPSL